MNPLDQIHEPVNLNYIRELENFKAFEKSLDKLFVFNFKHYASVYALRGNKAISYEIYDSGDKISTYELAGGNRKEVSSCYGETRLYKTISKLSSHFNSKK